MNLTLATDGSRKHYLNFIKTQNNLAARYPNHQNNPLSDTLRLMRQGVAYKHVGRQQSNDMDAKSLCEGTVFRMAHADAPASNTLSTSHHMHFRRDGGVMLNPVAAIARWDRMIALPHGNQMRCHIPHYAVHLNFGDGQFFTAAICWECNNISISSSGDYSWRTFHGQSDAAQSLLAYIRELVPDDDTDT